MGKKNIVLTGGHAATTAIAVVEELRSRKLFENYNIYWIGPKSSVEGKKTKPIELSVLPELGVRVEQITAGRLQRKFTLWTLPSLVKIPMGFINALLLLLKIKPEIILSFGGYAAFPVVVVGKMFGVKTILHEQTVAAGRANIFSARFADIVAIGREESGKYFPKEKTVFTGNPVIKTIRNATAKKTKSVIPTIFVTLGSRGSQRINEVVGKVLPNLLSDYKVIHLTGELDYEVFKKKKDELSEKLKKNYEIYSTVNPLEIHKFYEETEIVLGRAGANTVSEIILLKIPSILIPIPFSFENEQFKNAKYAESLGIATVLEEKDLSPDSLLKGIEKLITDWQHMKDNVKDKTSPDINAGKNLVDLIEENL